MASRAFVQPETVEPAAPTAALTLLVLLPSRWKEFPGNLRVALGPGGRRLAIENAIGKLSPDWLGVSAVAHIVTTIALIWLIPVLPLDLPVVLDERPSDYKVVYYPTPSLPQMEDSRPAKSGSSDTSPAEEAYHPTQTIRVSRGSILRSTVVDVPEHFLKRVATPTANLLSLATPSSSSAPVLQAPPAPVEVKKAASKLAHATKLAPAAVAPDLSRVGTKSLPQLSGVKSEVSLAPQPAPSFPRSQVDTELQQTTDIRNAPLTPVPDQTAEPQPPQTVASNEPPAIVISINSSDAVAVPASGGPGSLAMSPRGHSPSEGKTPGLGEKTSATGHGNGAPGTATRPGAAGGGNTSGNSGNGTAPGLGGSANNSVASRTMGPGVTVRGGVVSLDSFGPKPGAGGNSVANRSTADPPRRPAPVIVVATGRSGGGLGRYGVFKSQQVYTVYLQTTSGSAVLEFALHNPTSSSGDLTPPDAIKAELPPVNNRNGLVISCLLDSSGNLQNIRVVEGTSANLQAVTDAVRTWRFHPALMGGLPVAVDALIGIGVGH
jgi:TonB-like protein